MCNRKQVILLIFFYSTIITVSVDSKTIIIPDEAKSFQKAVDLAVSGDEIHVATRIFGWVESRIGPDGMSVNEPTGVIILDKKIYLKGILPQERPIALLSPFTRSTAESSATLKLINSTLTIENISLPEPLKGMNYGGSPQASPTIIDHSTMNIINCDLTGYIICNGNLNIWGSTIRGYSRVAAVPYTEFTASWPSIHFFNTNNLHVNFYNSTIHSDSNYSFINVVIEKIRNSHFYFENCQFIGGSHKVGYGSFGGAPGSDGLRIQDCENILISTQDCKFVGGEGYDAQGHRHGILLGGSNGGSGMALHNSQIILNIRDDFTLKGKRGGNGLATEDIYQLFESKHIIHAGNGGHGLALYNSTLTTNQFPLENFITAQGGPGGEGMQAGEYVAEPGEDGKPIYLDGNSTIQSLSNIEHWFLF